MNILSLLTYTSFIIYLIFSIFILYLNHREVINRIFCLLSTVLAIWSFADTFYYTAADKDTAMIFWKISTIGWILSPAIMLHLMLLIARFNKFIDSYIKIIILYLPAIIFEILALTTNFYLKDIFLTPYGWADLINPDLFITKSYLLYYLIYSLLSLLVVYLWGKNSNNPDIRKQSAVIFIFSFISLLLAFLTNTLQIAFGDRFQIPAFAEVFLLFWILGIMLAIKRYHFLTKEKEISFLNEKIELEKKIVSIQSEYIRNQNYILEMLFDFFRGNSNENAFDFIADKIYQIGNIKLLMITEYIPESNEFFLKAIRGEDKIKNEFIEIIKTSIKKPGVKINADKVNMIIEKLLSSHIVKLNGGLYEGIGNAIDKEIIEGLVVEYFLGDAYSIGFSSGNNLLGAATIIVEKGKDLDNIEFLEILINVLSLILQKSQLDQKLRKSEELHRAIFEHSDDCIYILDKNGILLSISPSFERITGYKVSDFINKSMAAIIHPDDIEEAFTMLNDVINGSIPKRKVIRVLNFKKEIIYGEFAATRLNIGNGNYALLGIGRDVTERLKNEEIIKNYQKELEIKSTRIETVGVMATGVLHDLNNILMNISAKINKIKENNSLSKDILEYIKDIDKTLSVANRLSKNLFDISGGKIISTKETTIKTIILENIELLVRDNKYRLKLDIPDDILWPIPDLTYFIQITNNLIINALQAMPDGGDISISISNCQREKSTYLILSIKDTGPGIPPDIINRIYEPFFTTKSNGTGLGLYIVKSIVNSYGGDIEIKSEIGKGTEFTIYLPEKRDTTKLNTEIKNDEKKKTIQNVLIVDDDHNILELTSDMISYLGFHPFLASTGADALELLRQNNIDAVILDLHLQDKTDAISTLKKIREIKQNVKVIICSGSPADPFLKRYTSYGFDGAIAKPFNLKDLENALR